MRRVRVTVTVEVPDVQYVDLPAGWDSWGPQRQQAFLWRVQEEQEGQVTIGSDVVITDD